MTESKTLTDAEEDTARADLYGLLAALFYRAPDAGILHQIATNRAQGEAATSALGEAWNGLAESAGSLLTEDIAAEYAALFIGVGKPDIFLYGSYYIAGFLNEKPLVALRDDLARYGLERGDDVSETEDHLSTLCEVMRYLIAGDDPTISNLAEQRQFFARHLQPWVETLCTQIESHPAADFYAHASRLARSFFEVEAVALEMT
jgi:TorA maturation chaperone TorD